ncbi:MAG: hypothetical protein BGO26_12485 [Actinobacteria bacterium 69-20]|nr:hypothetical protein [Actinomycetota bacterium]OJV23516.1 MAG: hypothetical protein BGO26_12485 [Actinobacteria bacterium 69-20]
MADGSDASVELETLPVPMDGVVTLVDQAVYAARWRPELRHDRIRLLEIDVAGVDDKPRFFRRVTEALGVERAPNAADKWSALEDHLWSAIATADAPFAVVVLLHADDLLDGALAELIEMCDIVRSMARMAATAEGGLARAVEVSLILAGTGPNFPPGE